VTGEYLLWSGVKPLRLNISIISSSELNPFDIVMVCHKITF
jgi:hypothetical protein